MSFARNKAALDDISSVITNRTSVLNNLLVQATQTEAALNALQNDYQSIIANINQNAADNPNNAAYQVQKAEKDLMVAEFIDLKNTAESIKIAIDNILNP